MKNNIPIKKVDEEKNRKFLKEEHANDQKVYKKSLLFIIIFHMYLGYQSFI